MLNNCLYYELITDAYWPLDLPIISMVWVDLIFWSTLLPLNGSVCVSRFIHHFLNIIGRLLYCFY